MQSLVEVVEVVEAVEVAGFNSTLRPGFILEMSTATTTTSQIPLSRRSTSNTSSTKPIEGIEGIPTLRSLYSRATHSFVQRDLAQTHSLVDQAFKLLSPPSSPLSLVDGVTSYRRKWDILRITLSTTQYSSTQSPTPKDENKDLQLAPNDFVQSLRTRSFRLFTPQSLSPSAGYVPPQVILLLAVSALKFGVVTLAREIIEDWLAKRGQDDSLEDALAYEKIMEVYSLHVLARLGAWEDAREFMRYEGELPEEVQQVCVRPNNFVPANYGLNSACFRPWK